MNNTNYEELHENGTEPIYKRPWFITLGIIIAILIGFAILFFFLKNKIDNTITATIGNINIKVEVVDENYNNTNIAISTALINRIKNNTDIDVVYYDGGLSCSLVGPIIINGTDWGEIDATVINTSQQILQVSRGAIGELLPDGISSKDKLILCLYVLGICLVVYLVSIFAFDDSVVVTYNGVDKFVLIATGILVAIYALFAQEYGDTQFIMWVKYIAIVCAAITLIFTLVGNIPNPLFVFLGLLAKLFLIVFIAIVVAVIVLIFIVTIILSIATAGSDGDREEWEISYDRYLDRIIATRRR